MAERASMYAVCPYYKRTLQNRICCEGLFKRNTINLVFEDTHGNDKYRRAYCQSLNNYKHCRVCRMLDEMYAEEL